MRVDELFWRFRGANWAETCISSSSIAHPHREWMVNYMMGCFPGMKSIIELGCGPGQNLFVIHSVNDSISLTGLDINSAAIKTGRRFFAQKGVAVELIRASIENLSRFLDKSFDVVLTDAVLIYTPPESIQGICRDMVRIARHGLFLVEIVSTSRQSLYTDYWAHDYVDIFSGFPEVLSVVRTKIPLELWGSNWGANGYAICVKLKDVA